ncbi:MAG: hypothetical protein WCI67_08935 [Chloroflexales bacterium]
MTSPISNHPRGVRGAFVEYSLGPPPLVVPFQFNPVQLQRNRSLAFSLPGEKKPDIAAGDGLRKLHQEQKNLMTLQEKQLVTVQEEAISLEVRLDATDGINAGNPLAARFGIAPQIAVLEQLVTPRKDTLLGNILTKLSGSGGRFSYTKGPNPPLVLFVWGSRWALPVNIGSMNIAESEFNSGLYPLRATVTLSLTVIEGPNAPYTGSLRAREAMAAAGLASTILNVVDVQIPG